MSDDVPVVIAEWVAVVERELGIHPHLDVGAILALAGVAAHAVVRPAAPVTTYLVGYAAGIAAAGGDDAFARLDAAVRQIASLRRAEGPPQ